jgi:hypothetical protein
LFGDGVGDGSSNGSFFNDGGGNERSVTSSGSFDFAGGGNCGNSFGGALTGCWLLLGREELITNN